jgi:hypothetical protein
MHHSDLPSGRMMIANVSIPMRLHPRMNARWSWRKTHATNKKERRATRLLLGPQIESAGEELLVFGGDLFVDFVRFSPGTLDSDNLVTCFKAVRDEVAGMLGRDDSPTSGITWRYDQAKIKRGESHFFTITIWG